MRECVWVEYWCQSQTIILSKWRTFGSQALQLQKTRRTFYFLKCLSFVSDVKTRLSGHFSFCTTQHPEQLSNVVDKHLVLFFFFLSFCVYQLLVLSLESEPGHNRRRTELCSSMPTTGPSLHLLIQSAMFNLMTTIAKCRRECVVTLLHNARAFGGRFRS